MIDLEQYQVQIGEHDLYDLLFQQRYDQQGETPPSGTELSDPLEKAETQAQSIIKQRFGYLPADTGFLETATVAGVIYLLSRKPKNQLDQDVIDARRQTFFDMLPAGAGPQRR